MTADEGKEGFSSLKAGSKNAKAVEAYYDAWAESYNDTLRQWDYRAAADAAELLAAYVTGGITILDVGCGTGLFGEALACRLDCRLVGLDISASSLEIADRQGRYEKLCRHDLQALPLPMDDNGFDAAVCVGVMTYIDDAEALLSDLCRLVRTGGHILFTHRNDLWAGEEFDAIVGRLETCGLWTPLRITEPRPYLPRNDDFGAEIGVIYALLQVSGPKYQDR